jgi:valyl-tRNA synthetase
VADRWILSRLAAAVTRTNGGFTDYLFAEVTTAIYNFWLYDLCDVYLELIKPIVKTTDTSPAAVGARASSLATLYTCLRTGLLLLHPLMPFISEELYHRLPQAMTTEEERAGTGGRMACGSIMVQPYPSVEEFARFVNPDIEALLSTMQDIGKAARSVRANLGLTKKRVDLHLLCADGALATQLAPHTRDIATLAVGNAVYVLPPEGRDSIPKGCTTAVVSPTLELHIPLRGLVDFGAEVVKMEKQRDALREGVSSLQAKMAAPGYDKTKAEVRERNDVKVRDDTAEIDKLTQSIDAFKGLMSPEEKVQYLQQKVSSKKADAERVKVGMEKILPAGGDEAKLSKKIAGKYGDLKKEYLQLTNEQEQWQAEVTREMERLQLKH